MATARVTLLGRLAPVEPAKRAAAEAAYLLKHPMAAEWIGFEDFQLYVMDVEDVYWVGGFGDGHYIGWVAATEFLAHCEHLL